MKKLFYPNTKIQIRVGDKVRWYDDEELSEVIFIISTREYRADYMNSIDWFISEFQTGIMIDTPSAGLVLEDEECSNITFIQSAINND